MKICSEEGCDSKHRAKGLCQSHYKKAVYKENKDYFKAKSLSWYYDNLEDAKKSRKQWREQHKESVASKKKAYYEANKDADKERRRAYSKANSQATVERVRQWRRANPEAKKAAQDRRRYPSDISLSVEERSQAVAQRVELKNYPCVYCGEYAEIMHIDHATPLSKGGLDVAGNLLSSCQNCNLRKHTKTAEEFIELLETERLSAYVEREKEIKL